MPEDVQNTDTGNEMLMPDEPNLDPADQSDHGPPEPKTFRALNRGNLILVAMFAAGIGCVYLLSLWNGPAEASAQQQQTELNVENALTLLNSTFPDKPETTAKLVKKFYCEIKQRQIPLSALSSNPFVFTAPKQVAKEPVRRKPTAPKETPEQRMLSEAMSAVRKLKLQSVLTGSAGAAAMISSNLLTEGQKIRGWTVSRIQPQQVVLIWNEHTYVLKIAQQRR